MVQLFINIFTLVALVLIVGMTIAFAGEIDKLRARIAKLEEENNVGY